jgi:hypothetical protein
MTDTASGALAAGLGGTLLIADAYIAVATAATPVDAVLSSPGLIFLCHSVSV